MVAIPIAPTVGIMGHAYHTPDCEPVLFPKARRWPCVWITGMLPTPSTACRDRFCTVSGLSRCWVRLPREQIADFGHCNVTPIALRKGLVRFTSGPARYRVTKKRFHFVGCLASLFLRGEFSLSHIAPILIRVKNANKFLKLVKEDIEDSKVGPVNYDIHSKALVGLLRIRGRQQFRSKTGCQVFQLAYHTIVCSLNNYSCNAAQSYLC